MKQLKIVLIIIGILAFVIVLDTLQALVFEINPLISWKVNLGDNNSIAKGILLDTYYCVDDYNKIDISWHFKSSKFSCPVYEKEDVSFMETTEEENNMIENIKIKVNDNVLDVELANTTAASALVQILRNQDITVEVDDYGSFEKVGSLPFSLPTSDIQITTTPGDIMLYQGDKITIFYESNTWSYTRLGKIVGVSNEEIKSIIGKDSTSIVLSLN